MVHINWMMFIPFAPLLIEEVKAFEQADYNLTSERMEIMEYDKNWMIVKTKNFKYNRSLAVINMTMEVVKEVGFDMEYFIESYKFVSNEYRAFPMNFKVNVCETIARNDFGIQNIYACGNLPRCPLPKGRYIICNWTFDGSKFPPYIPSGRYMAEMKWMLHSQQIVRSQWYFKVEKKFRFIK